MREALENYARYRESPESWMLGRFVVPLASADLVAAKNWPVTAVAGADFGANLAGIDSLEIKVADLAQIDETMRRAPRGLTVYFEVSGVSLIPAIRAAGARAKIRMGGVTPEAFPDPARIARFLEACASTGTPFKATAGLHHPLRCYRPLTYEAGGPSSWMYGFLNVFLAAVLVRRGVEIEPLLTEESPEAFAFADDAITWSGHIAMTEEIASARRDFAISFGSCSFEEPVADLKSLNFI
jgi:hypothetical protein